VVDSFKMYKPKSKHRPWDRIRNSESQKAPIVKRKRDEFYHTARWKKESRAFLMQNPLCRQCERDGFIVPSQITDHIIPKNACRDPWDKNNWQPLCKKHNLAKGAQDKKRFKK
jgi:5-methylcytosine-specific restriction enzyme A